MPPVVRARDGNAAVIDEGDVYRTLVFVDGHGVVRDVRHDVHPRCLADRQRAQGSGAHLYFTLSTAVFMTESKKP